MGLEARLPPALPDDSPLRHDKDSSPLQEDAACELPVLTVTPIAYSGCCLGLSAPLIAYLRSLIPPSPSLTLSVGSGFGLLEAYLLASTTNIIGLEVEPSSNQYLPSKNHRVVHGSRFLDPVATDATAWLFVYPRRVGLVQEYLTEYGKGNVETLIWAGPRADWEDYKGCFGGWIVREQSADEVGGRTWEMVAVATKQPS
ncbi:hypothetical protein BDW02DRAFT_355970 [Decorospora gaudefroyi]|uniref:S-adenosyl-L-methionine-dependent methyltransferase n=1 Tax=Decorospora gaudefroyi TaxID=184978 RepID=A0A6A5KCR2_9PLEO|nr:hypothetical protein BDW02DRAFT_355970 [Decorospora gaudefroyi]